MSGWIKLHRKIHDSAMYNNLNAIQRDVLINCLLMANHEKKEWYWGNKLHVCEPGQFITSLENIRRLCAKGTSIKNVRTSLDKLKKMDFLANESAKTGRLITILNWDTYQSSDDDTGKDTGKEVAKRWQRGGKEVATNKNVKNYKNEKNYKNRNTETHYLDASFEAPNKSYEKKIFETLKKCFDDRLESMKPSAVEKMVTNLANPIFGNVDVPHQIQRAAIWESSKGAKKTSRGLSRFLVGWIDRQQNSTQRNGNSGGPRGIETREEGARRRNDDLLAQRRAEIENEQFGSD